MSFQDYVTAVANTAIEFPQLKAAMLAQSIMESGREDTRIAKEHNNHHGMKWRPEMQGYATSVHYKTDSEPTGGADFCKFASKEAEVKGYWHFLTRSPYAGWKDHAQNASSFLAFICPIWCPAGYTAEWKAAHGGLSYHQYVLAKLLPEAEKLLSEAKPDSEAETITKIVLNRKDDGTPVATAYAGDSPRWTHIVGANSFEDFKSWCEQFPNAKLIGVEDTSKSFPKLPDYGVAVEPQKPEPTDKLPLIVPFAKQYKCNMKNQGKYPKGFPEGMIVHFTAGRGTAEGMLDYCVSKGYTVTLAIDKTGNIVQATPLNVWGYHCATFHQETHIGVEIVNAGRLEKKADGTFWSWFGTQIPKENVRYIADTAEQIAGYYEEYTPEQEAALIKLILWLRDGGKGIFKLDNVIGHDEACARSSRGRGAKNDPGGALSMLMPKFREFLRSK
jgi:hypothetical protein